MKRTLLACLVLAGSAFAQRVPWAYETPMVPSNQSGDPTFLLAPQPTVVGTDTNQSNLFFYALGQPAVSLPVGPVTSADARGTLLAVAALNVNTVLMFEARDGGFTQLNTSGFTVPSPRHVALRKTSAGTFELYVDTSSQTIEHFRLAISNDTVTFTSEPSLHVVEPSSGIAVDDRTGQLYAAQPSLGVVRVEAGTQAGFLVSIDAGHLGSVVGGVDLLLAADGGTLVFTTAPNEGQINVHSGGGTYLTTLTVGDVDGGPGSLGTPQFLDVFDQPVPGVPGFPLGVLVVQDATTSNYKVVSLGDVNAVFPLPPAFIPSVASDAGAVDGGASDGGVTDAGAPSDGGTNDAGSTGTGGGSGGRPAGPAPSAEPVPANCGCTGGPFALLPGVLLLWWIRRRPTRS